MEAAVLARREEHSGRRCGSEGGGGGGHERGGHHLRRNMCRTSPYWRKYSRALEQVRAGKWAALRLRADGEVAVYLALHCGNYGLADDPRLASAGVETIWAVKRSDDIVVREDERYGGEFRPPRQLVLSSAWLEVAWMIVMKSRERAVGAMQIRTAQYRQRYPSYYPHSHC